MKSYPYFPARELSCKCGQCLGGHSMEDEFMERLISLREEVGPLPLSSAYRCSAYNCIVSSTGPNGPHTTGEAVDIACPSGARRLQLVDAARRHGFNRIGVGKNFIHLDSLTALKGFPENVMWTY